MGNVGKGHAWRYTRQDPNVNVKYAVKAKTDAWSCEAAGGAFEHAALLHR